MDLYISEEGIHTVIYHEEHSGHALDKQSLAHTQIPKAERAYIAGKLAECIPKDEILNQTRKWQGRSGLIKKRDLNNIISEFNLKNLDTLHADEYTSCVLLIDQLGDEVLYCKHQKVVDLRNPEIGVNDFVLIIMKNAQQIVLQQHIENENLLEICMDSTHGMSAKKFEATTLMCVTDRNEGFPLSVCISSTVNIPIITLFLKKVGERVGPLKAHVFMSDCSTIFREGWLNAMGTDSITHALTCSWHTDRAWRKNADAIPNLDRSTKVRIYKTCQALKETREVEEFNRFASSFLAYLKGLGCDEFHDYFEKYLAEDKVYLWAMCYRHGLHLHTNNFLEAMHRVLKHVFMHGKKISRLDLAILAYMKLVDFKIHQRMVNLIFGTRDKVFARKHSAGIKLQVVQKDESSFYVTSESNKDHCYIVEKLQDCNGCKSRCSACKACRHMIKCECEDYKRHLCKHGHALMFYLIRTMRISLPEPRPADNEIQLLHNEVTAEDGSLENIMCTQRSDINVLLEQIRQISISKDYSYEIFETAKKQLHSVKGIFAAASIEVPHSNSITIREPSNKRIVQQRSYQSFYTTKKPCGKTPAVPLEGLNGGHEREIIQTAFLEYDFNA